MDLSTYLDAEKLGLYASQSRAAGYLREVVTLAESNMVELVSNEKILGSNTPLARGLPFLYVRFVRLGSNGGRLAT